jgi:F-type H+-transporting ATPase subunit b
VSSGSRANHAIGRLLLATCFVAPHTAFAAEGAGLNLFPDPVKLAINFTVLLLLIPVVNRLLLQPLTRVLQERDERTEGSNARAAGLVEEASGSRVEIDRLVGEAAAASQRTRSEIGKQAETEVREIIAAARGQAAEEIERMRTEIGAELDGARATLRAETEPLARAAAERILGRSL